MGFLDRLRIGATLGLGSALVSLIGPILAGQVPLERIGAHVAFKVMGVNDRDNSFDIKRTLPFWVPLVGGVAVSAVAAKAGVNRYLPKGIKL